MHRRRFIALLGAAITAARTLRAQQKAMPVIGFLSSNAPGTYAPAVAAFRQGLAETGYIEGQNVAIEYRWAEGRYDRLPALAAELVGRNVEVIAAGSLTAIRAAKARPRRHRSSFSAAMTRSSRASSPASPDRAATSRASASWQAN